VRRDGRIRVGDRVPIAREPTRAENTSRLSGSAARFDIVHFTERHHLRVKLAWNV
jgi:hypothetical protein